MSSFVMYLVGGKLEIIPVGIADQVQETRYNQLNHPINSNYFHEITAKSYFFK